MKTSYVQKAAAKLSSSCQKIVVNLSISSFGMEPPSSSYLKRKVRRMLSERNFLSKQLNTRWCSMLHWDTFGKKHCLERFFRYLASCSTSAMIFGVQPVVICSDWLHSETSHSREILKMEFLKSYKITIQDGRRWKKYCWHRVPLTFPPPPSLSWVSRLR